jgi:NAD(P)-dependent dehydrogenase (short-subunit alcohol dehydrogenase family)
MSAAVTLPKAPSFRLDGRRALVTGASRGLGLAMAAALAEAGADVMLLARSGEEVERAAEAIRARGDRAEALALDVTDTGA